MKEITLKRHKLPDLEFKGERLSIASSYAEGSARWTELELYKTKGGSFVCYKLGRSAIDGEETFITCDICNTTQCVFEHFGSGKLARDIYQQANITATRID